MFPEEYIKARITFYTTLCAEYTTNKFSHNTLNTLSLHPDYKAIIWTDNNNRMKRIFSITLALICLTPLCRAQKIAVKSNLLYGIGTYTPNLGVEWGIGPRGTLDIGGGYHPWNLQGSESNNRKRVHWLGSIEYRYWFCERFSGHFVGVHALGSQYNISQHQLPWLFGKGSENYRYQGYGYGGGISSGYQWILGKRWNLEALFGMGYAQLHFDKYACRKCGDKLAAEKRHYWGPTQAGVSLIYLIK